MEKYRLGILVTVEAEGMDQGDARNRAESAVAYMLDTVTGVVHTPERPNIEQTAVEIHDVSEINSAALNGQLRIGVAPKRKS
jgi:hypothetical protein